MAKFLTLAQLQKEFGITMRSLKELMQREIYEPVKSIADQAKAIAAGVRKDADEGRFDGAPGAQGPQGEKGEPGETGAQGEPGRDGQDGQDGQDGAPGEDGYTPVRGVDYWTNEDKTEIVSDTETALAPTLALKADKSSLADTDRRLSLLYDLTRGQAWRTEQSTTEAYSKVVPSGAHAVELESIGGKSAMVGDSPVHADVDRMEIHGKNYFNPDDYYNLYTNREYNIGGYATKAIHLRPNTTYTVSIHAAAAKSAPAFLINVQSYVSKEPYCDLRKVSDTRTYTTGADGNLYIGTNGVDAPTNRRLAEIEVQIEIGSAATAYSPYHAPTEYPIPAAVRALEGYGQSEVGGQGNTVDFSNGIYTEYGHYEDGAWVSEDTPIVTDISDLLTDFDPLMDVEGGGALTFHQSGGTELAVPNSETYFINIAEALT